MWRWTGDERRAREQGSRYPAGSRRVPGRRGPRKSLEEEKKGRWSSAGVIAWCVGLGTVRDSSADGGAIEEEVMVLDSDRGALGRGRERGVSAARVDGGGVDVVSLEPERGAPGGGVEPGGGVLVEERGDEVVDGLGRVGAEDVLEEAPRRVRGEGGEAAVLDAVDDAAEGPPVDGLAVADAFPKDLGRGVVERAAKAAEAVVRRELDGEAEVGEDEVARVVDENVRWLDVAMDDVELVKRLDCGRKLGEGQRRLALRLDHPALERPSLGVVHHERGQLRGPRERVPQSRHVRPTRDQAEHGGFLRPEPHHFLRVQRVRVLASPFPRQIDAPERPPTQHAHALERPPRLVFLASARLLRRALLPRLLPLRGRGGLVACLPAPERPEHPPQAPQSTLLRPRLGLLVPTSDRLRRGRRLDRHERFVAPVAPTLLDAVPGLEGDSRVRMHRPAQQGPFD
mmetsp:Transcript_22715/g.71113  ORF Transcript_22715/g.71113 Transcript_22715/m.71113 type:complete len:456 (-) Transcript_22715:226-1593(-)